MAYNGGMLVDASKLRAVASSAATLTALAAALQTALQALDDSDVIISLYVGKGQSHGNYEYLLAYQIA
jgi:hypothetical protein